MRERGNDTPFLFVSGTIGEDRAVAAMKAGADDYIIKGNLKRLIPAVNRELREAEVRQERKKAEEALQESNQTLEAVVQSSPLAIIVIDPTGNVRMWNPAAEQILGWSAREVLGHPIPIRPEETKKETREAEREVKRFVNLERRYKRKDGVLIDTSISTSLLCDNHGEISGVMWIIADITERKRAEATIKQMAYYDTLTALPNRALLHDRLQQAIPAAADENKSVGLLLLDLDRFREINDTLGHPRGDALLQQIGPRLHAVLQPSDTIARLGGDEFAVMLPRIDSEQAALAAGRLLKALEKPFLIEGIPIVIEASIGMALSPEHGENPDSLIQHADIAMYVAKENKKGVALYSSKVDKHSPRRLALLGELRDAIENNHLFLVYQPKIHLWTRRVIGVEALVRWQHPQYGVIPPDQFITIAEHSGLIQPLTLWVVKTALAQCKIWQREGKAPNVAVNLSARNLEDPELPDQIAGLLEASGVGSASLNLEITESALMVNPTQAMEILTRLNDMAIQLSIDDFGTGYSSLGYLKKLPVHQIKIDKSFVKEMATDEEDAIIVRSTIELTHNLGLKVVAEGVESEEVLEKLAALDCDAAQGYHISRPLPPSELNAWFTETAPAKGWNL